MPSSESVGLPRNCSISFCKAPWPWHRTINPCSANGVVIRPWTRSLRRLGREEPQPPPLEESDTWSLPGRRKRVRHESPQGSRVNAMAAYRPYDRAPRLEVFTAERTWDLYDFLAFVRALPRAKVPRVVVLDNACLHTSGVVKRARRRLAAARIYLYFLPPYAPELNEVEPVFRQVKYQEIPVRSHATRAGLREAVEGGFDSYCRGLRSRSERKPRRAARPRPASRPPPSTAASSTARAPLPTGRRSRRWARTQGRWRRP